MADPIVGSNATANASAAGINGNNVTGTGLDSTVKPESNNPVASKSAESGTTFVSSNAMSSFYMPDGRMIVFGPDGKYVTEDEAEIEELSKACLSSHGAIRKL